MTELASRIAELMPRAQADLTELVTIPSVADPRQYPPEECHKAAQWVVFLGHGGSIPLCNVLAETYPRAEIVLMGVEEPRCLIHAPNESVDPSEIEHMAHVEALFLREFAKSRGR